MYTPLNIDVFCNAFAGAYTAITNGERRITSPHEADYLEQANVAFAIAEEMDTVWAGAASDFYEENAILLGCYGQWLERPPTSTNPLSYAVDCNAIMAMVLEGEAVINGGGIIPPSPGGSSPLSRERWIDGDTTTPAAQQNGSEGKPFKNLTNFVAAFGANTSAADGITPIVALLTPSKAGYTEDVTLTPFRSTTIRGEYEPTGVSAAPGLTTGNLVWHNSVAAGGVHPPSSDTLVIDRWGFSGSITITDDGSVPSTLVLYGEEATTVVCGAGIDVSGCTALSAITAVGVFVEGVVTSTANGTGAILKATNSIFEEGAIVCQAIDATETAFGAPTITTADASNSVLNQCRFLTATVWAAGAGSTVTMDRYTYQSFLESGSSLSTGTLFVVPTQDHLFAPTDVVAGAVIAMGHGTANFHSMDMTAAAITVNLDPSPTHGQRYRAKNSGVGATPAIINATGGFAIETYGNQGHYSAANGDSPFAGAGQGEVCEWVFNKNLTVGGVTGVWEIAFTA